MGRAYEHNERDDEYTTQALYYVSEQTSREKLAYKYQEGDRRQ